MDQTHGGFVDERHAVPVRFRKIAGGIEMVPGGGRKATHHIYLPEVGRQGVGIVVAVNFLHRLHLRLITGNGALQVPGGHGVVGAVGIVGGMTKCHPTACVALKILGVKSAGELASVMASV
ncbi:MAG: hypothetical protein KKG00_15880, partial [Bacteroidetes bacterium]|nr:hypothetical protein [Bacteroidota bacterium]